MSDPLADMLQAPEIEPVAPPAGHYDEIVRRAHRRRNRRAAAVTAVLMTAVLAGAVGGSALLVRNGSVSAPATHDTSHQTPTGAPTSPMHPSATAGRAGVSAALGTGPMPARFKPWSVTSVSADVTFVLGDAPCRRSPCTSLVVTGDHGHTWQGLPAPRAALPANRFGPAPGVGEVSEVRFANPRDGWVFGGALYATHDGGRHWRALNLPDPAGKRVTIRQLETDGRTAYALVATCSAGGCADYRLYQAAVGTDGWAPAAGVDPPASANRGLLSVSGSQAILGLAGAGAARVWVHRSAWVRVPAPPCPGGGLPATVTAGASGAAVFALCGEGAAGSLYLSPFVSPDGGAGWHAVADGSARVTNGSISAASASPSLLLVASGSPDLGGPLLRSVDGGATFARAALPRLASGWWYVGARTATSLVALPGEPDGSLWSSHDGGLTWQAYRFR